MRFSKQLSLFLIVLFSVTAIHAQRDVTELLESKRPQLDNLPEVALLRAEPGNPPGLDLKEIKQYQFFSVDQAAMDKRKNGNRDVLKLKLTYNNRPIILELVKIDLFGDYGQVTQASNGASVAVERGDYYWGKVRGKANSLAALSIFENNIEGLISIDEERFNLGKVANDAAHIMYLANDVPLDQPECLAESLVEDFSETTGEAIPEASGTTVGSVGVYYEVDYDIYQSKNSSITETTNYITAILNEVAILYANESINLYISEIKIWDTPDPYEGLSGSSTRLTTFRDNLNGNYNGDLAHLLSFDGGGGIAYVNVLCNDFYGVGYSGINNSYNTVPTYSWTVMVITHELGHNFGSPHTHSCAWNGNSTPIDGCGIQAGYGDSGCTDPAPIPSAGGTVMSYCHLTSAGIDLSLGFGQQPGDLIRSRVVSATSSGCLNTCTIGAACNDGDDCTTNDVYDAGCNCAGTPLPDSDGDGVCDANDICPSGDDTIDTDNDGIPDACDDCNNNLVGTACDDGDDCTTGDVYDADCNCAGIAADSDGDGVCDANDTCPGGDDTADANGNNIPDACEVTCINQTTAFPQNPLTHSGGGTASTSLTFVDITKDVQFTIAEINSKTNGKTDRRFTEEVTVEYVDGNGNAKLYGTYNGQNTSSATININEIVSSITISLSNVYGNTTSAQMSVSISTVSICAEPCQDDDNDGVCNTVDACPGSDDAQDADGDGIPNGCDNCNNVVSNFANNPLTHSGGGSTTTTLNLGNQTDVSFSINQLGARTGGKPSNRHIDVVTVTYIDGNSQAQTYGTFSGQNQNAVNINIPGAVSQLTVALSDGYAGGSSTIEVNLSTVVACQTPSTALIQPTINANSAVRQDFAFEVYPNPFQASIQVNLINNNQGIVRVVDYYGRVIYQSKVDKQTDFNQTLNTNNWSSGLYYIEYFDGKQHEIRKVVKTR